MGYSESEACNRMPMEVEVEGESDEHEYRDMYRYKKE